LLLTKNGSKVLLDSKKLYVGDTWDFTESISDYPASSYTVTCYLKYQTSATISIVGVADGDDHQFVKTAAATAAYTAGKYQYQFVAVDDGGVKTTTATGIITVYDALETATDSRGYWAKRLADLQTAYTNMAGREYTEIEIAGRKVKYSRTELLSELSYAEYRAEREDRKLKGQGTKKIKVKFIETS